MSPRLCLISSAILLAAGCASNPHPWSSGRWVDLTHSFSGETIYWPTSEQFHLEAVSSGITDIGYYYAANQFCAAEHGGTHVDAPIHFASGGPTIDQVPLQKLVGPTAVIDIRAKAAANRDYRVSVGDLLDWETRHGPIPAGTIVMLYTGYDRYWPDALRYLGTGERGADAVSKLHFPGLHPDAARWLTQQRKIKAVGLDTASIDYGQSTHFESHQILARSGTPIFENAAGLGALPATGAWLIALPMKIGGGSGAPLRLVAWVP